MSTLKRERLLAQHDSLDPVEIKKIVFTNFGSGTAIHKIRHLVRSIEYSRVLNEGQRSKKSFFQKPETNSDVCV